MKNTPSQSMVVPAAGLAFACEERDQCRGDDGQDHHEPEDAAEAVMLGEVAAHERSPRRPRRSLTAVIRPISVPYFLWAADGEECSIIRHSGTVGPLTPWVTQPTKSQVTSGASAAMTVARYGYQDHHAHEDLVLPDDVAQAGQEEGERARLR